MMLSALDMPARDGVRLPATKLVAIVRSSLVLVNTPLLFRDRRGRVIMESC